jgi:signal transduction histidine kinase
LGLIEAGVLGELPEKAGALVKIAYQNCERLVRIINDILDVEKIKSGGMELHIANVPVAAFLQQALEVNQGFGLKYLVRFVLGPVDASDGESLVERREVFSARRRCKSARERTWRAGAH